MTKITLKEKIINAVKESESIDKKTISESTATKGIVLEGALAKLIKDKILQVELREGQKFYSVCPEFSETKATEEKTTGEKETEAPSQEKVKNKKDKKGKHDDDSGEGGSEKENISEKQGQVKAGKDIRKFKFDGELFNKAHLLNAVIKKHVEKHKNISLEKLKEAFPDTLLKRFGIVATIPFAKKMASGGRDRYLMQKEKIISVKGTKIVTCNQLTADNIKPFLTCARKLGYDIR